MCNIFKTFTTIIDSPQKHEKVHPPSPTSKILNLWSSTPYKNTKKYFWMPYGFWCFSISIHEEKHTQNNTVQVRSKQILLREDWIKNHTFVTIEWNAKDLAWMSSQYTISTATISVERWETHCIKTKTSTVAISGESPVFSSQKNVCGLYKMSPLIAPWPSSLCLLQKKRCQWFFFQHIIIGTF
jgi:hypothetical protein